MSSSARRVPTPFSSFPPSSRAAPSLLSMRLRFFFIPGSPFRRRSPPSGSVSRCAIDVPRRPSMRPVTRLGASTEKETRWPPHCCPRGARRGRAGGSMAEKRRKKPAELLQKPKGGNGNASDVSEPVPGKEPEGEGGTSRTEEVQSGRLDTSSQGIDRTLVGQTE